MCRIEKYEAIENDRMPAMVKRGRDNENSSVASKYVAAVSVADDR